MQHGLLRSTATWHIAAEFARIPKHRDDGARQDDKTPRQTPNNLPN
jgi:hypothetical protein